MEVPFESANRKKRDGKVPEGWNLDRSEIRTEDIIAQYPIAFKDLEDRRGSLQAMRRWDLYVSPGGIILSQTASFRRTGFDAPDAT